MLDVAENSDAFKQAAAALGPLEEAVAAFDAENERKQRARLEAEAAVRAAEDNARERAESAIKDDAAVIAARKKFSQVVCQ